VGSAILTIITTIVGFSSAVGIYSIIGHHQLLCMIPILPISFPAKINNFVTGFEYFMFSANFLFIEDSFNWSKDFIDTTKGQVNWYLHDIGVEFESTLINISTILKIVMLIASIHLTYMVVYKSCIKNRIPDQSRINNVHDYISTLFTYNIYVRFYMSVFMTLVLSICFELDEFSTSTSSLFITIVIGLFVIATVVGFTIHWLKSDLTNEEVKATKVKELYTDIKPSKIASANRIFELIRIIILSCIIAFGHHTNSKIASSMFILVTGVFLLYFIIFRPYKNLKENILQTIDELSLIVLLLVSVITEYTSDWGTAQESMYIGIVIGTSFIILVITTGTFTI
jgi:hypothetical protein